MHVLCAPDKFKGTLTALEAAQAMAAGVTDAAPDATVDVCPLADGGEGTLDALAKPLGLDLRRMRVTGPLGDPVDARYGVTSDGSLAVVELAEAAGLHHVPPDRRDPTRTTTAGVGELLRHLVAAGCPEVIVAVGGSATCDGGAGLAAALGAVFRATDGTPLPLPMCGGRLREIATIEWPRVHARVRVASDVEHELLGPHGAARTFAPQKGATPAQVEELESGLEHLVRCVERGDARQGERQPMEAIDRPDDRCVDQPNMQRVNQGGDQWKALRGIHGHPGAGAAGGAAYGLAIFARATLERGAELVVDALGFDARLRRADLVIAGEGGLDTASFRGKVVGSVISRAAAMGVPVLVIAGHVERGLAPPSLIRPAQAVRWTSLADRFGEDAYRHPVGSLRRATTELLLAYPRDDQPAGCA